MKTNELMIGDWMQHANGKYFRITRLDMWSDGSVHFACGHPHLWDYNNKFNPVLLTTEILEKNGFVPMKNNSGYVVVIGTIRIELRTGWPDENMAIWFNWDEDNDCVYYADFILPYPKFVHELQHTLRLCKINKEVEL